MNLKSTESRRSNRGLTFTGFLMIVFVVVLGWLAAEWSVGYFGMTKAQKIITETLLKNRQEPNDEEMKKVIIEALAAQGPIITTAENLSLFRSQDGTQMRVLFKYSRRVNLPMTEIGFDLPFETEVEEKLNRPTMF